MCHSLDRVLSISITLGENRLGGYIFDINNCRLDCYKFQTVKLEENPLSFLICFKVFNGSDERFRSKCLGIYI